VVLHSVVGQRGLAGEFVPLERVVSPGGWQAGGLKGELQNSKNRLLAQNGVSVLPEPTEAAAARERRSAEYCNSL
jgi:hypothetical protein